MKQLGLSIPLFIKRPKVTRQQKFLEEMERVIPWAEWTNRIAPRRAALSGSRFRTQAICVGSDVADSYDATMAWLFRSFDGRSVT